MWAEVHKNFDQNIYLPSTALNMLYVAISSTHKNLSLNLKIHFLSKRNFLSTSLWAAETCQIFGKLSSNF